MNFFQEVSAISGRVVVTVLLASVLFGCASKPMLEDTVPKRKSESPQYVIGPGDTLSVFVWGNADLSTSVPVRPDGRITTPLVEDVQASGRTPTELAREMESLLGRYIKNPVVTVTVTSFVGRSVEQIRVVGEAAQPSAIPYREHTTVLDVMIAVGGLTDYAAGNKALISRKINGKWQQFGVRLQDLLQDGDISANVEMEPGDILIIPDTLF